jgi:hypothetical protein
LNLPGSYLPGVSFGADISRINFLNSTGTFTRKTEENGQSTEQNPHIDRPIATHSGALVCSSARNHRNQAGTGEVNADPLAFFQGKAIAVAA